ncbi:MULTISPECIES: TorD/DmsD family molecular chaperone [Yersinia]|jgi:putative dimethyl sulfoxide reductase chaperone|uniref:TorD family cytoplasmic chaperone n=1 Tax=Yersinia intermedia TaxID=631 RepID=A0A0T9MDF3_YERIN|nr:MULTISPECIES: molecular chaperone [Yersinia]ARB84309.1 molecular chaperone [Yersinia sp. FDAARGOS_228]AVL38108.1 molecular chaperone [Yersinia intermedia]MCB5297864.1 molecular chaperone [Yersinia intermedia]MDA5494446.1 molecular chaperone [Yersinia intermedia]MDA5511962.1 molecular chaperone [Yersinia intermedia]
MLLNTTLPRILGACFYYPPQSDTVQRLWPLLPQIAELFPWSNPAKIARYCQQMPSIQPEQLEYDFSILFEGQGEMPAPPWGSVYLDKENILMGDSTLQYREFLSTFGLVNQSTIREPEDQFGLMLLAWVHLIEQQPVTKLPSGEAALVLLTEHLLPWAYRYLELVSSSQTEHQVYPLLAKITECYLQTLQTELGLFPQPRELFR